jgi:hypothetical protein|tara:strand:- start:248 stop:478 length:231 start_codon:yes stop_codon:yes gene_type:complete
MKPGDIIKLKGKTKHGKNRVREQGEFWGVIKLDIAKQYSIYSRGTLFVRLMSMDAKHWRNVACTNDINFDIIEEEN